MTRNNDLSIAAFLLPLLAGMGISGTANAACSVTSGSITTPDNGSTVTCPAGQTSTTTIGDGTTDATVILEDGHTIDRTAAINLTGIYLNNATVTLSDGSVIQTNTNSGNYGINAVNDATVTLGANSRIQSKYAINAGHDATVTLESGAQLIATDNIVGRGVAALNSLTLTVNANAQIISRYGMPVRGGTGSDYIDNSGLISGLNQSIQLRQGNDFLTLRTGSDLDSPNGAQGGAGTDTITLYGTNSEDEDFTGFEILNMEGDDWTLSGISTIVTSNVNSGRLANDGFLVGDVNINPGATYGGTGTTFGVITNDGTFDPGNSIGTHTITGDYIQAADGVLQIEYDDASADLVDITGTATLDGEVQFIPLTGSIPDGTAFTALQTTGGITGDFATITGTTFLAPQVTTGANNVTVVINRLPFTSVTTTSSSTAVASALDAAILSDPVAMADIDVLFNTLTADEAAALLDSQSGIAGTGAVLAGTQLLGSNTGVAMTRVGGVPSPGMMTASISGDAAPQTLDGIATAAGGYEMGTKLPHTWWLQATGAAGHTSGDSTARGTSYRSGGLTAGVDSTAIIENGTLGVFFGYSKSDGDVAGLRDDADVSIFQTGLYAGQSRGELNLQGAISAAVLEYSTSRFTPSGTARADFSGYAAQATAEVSRDYLRGKWALTPLAGLTGTVSYHDSYTETGAGLLNMRVGSNTTTQLSSAVGARFSRDVIFAHNGGADILFHPSFELAWTHEFLDNAPDISANFVAAPSAAFSTTGPDRKRDSLRVGFDLTAGKADDDKFNLYTSYDGSFSGDAVNHALTVGMRLKW